MEDESLVNDNAFRVAPVVGDASQMLVGEVVREDWIRAELFEARLALGAGVIGVHHATDRRGPLNRAQVPELWRPPHRFGNGAEETVRS